MGLAFFRRFLAIGDGLAEPLEQRVEDGREVIEEFFLGKIVGGRDLSVLPDTLHPISGDGVTLLMEEIREGGEGDYFRHS